MSLYSYRLESAVQDPSNTGNDLDQIEKDALESHDDEVERAEEEGLGEDPMEESAFILYEAEYNYNQIMRSIGVAEINEAAVGRQFVLTEADKTGFFTHIKEWFKRIFKVIADNIGKAVHAMDFKLKHQKKFVEKHKKEITDGFSKDWSKGGYPALINSDFVEKVTNGFKSFKSIIFTNQAEYVERDITEDDRKEKTEEMYKNFSSHYLGKEYTTDKDIRKAAIDIGKGERVDNMKGKISSPDTVIKILSNDRESRDLKDTLKSIKADIDATIKYIDASMKAGKLSSSDEEYGKTFDARRFEWISFMCDLERKRKSMMASLCSTTCSIAKSRRSLAMSLAVTWAKAGGAKIDAEDAKAIGGDANANTANGAEAQAQTDEGTTTTTEATSIFSNLDLV